MWAQIPRGVLRTLFTGTEAPSRPGRPQSPLCVPPLPPRRSSSGEEERPGSAAEVPTGPESRQRLETLGQDSGGGAQASVEPFRARVCMKQRT